MMSESGGGGGLASTPSQIRQVIDAFNRNASNSLHGPSRLEEHIGRAKSKISSTDVDIFRVTGPIRPLGGGNLSYRRLDPGGGGGQEAGLDLSKHPLWLRERFLQMHQQHKVGQEMLRQQQQAAQAERASHLTGEKIRQLSQRASEKLRMPVPSPNNLSAKHRGSKELEVAYKPGAGGHTPNVSAVPIMSSNDNNWAELEETIIDGERISCFVVGGEPRLCLPQFLNFVLARVELTDIKQACDKLQIYCATCSTQQLQILKEAKILPNTACQCGLITKSDAERLCSFLLERHPPRASIRMGDPKASPFSFRVEHDCFGRCEGLVLPEAYTSPDARCIECMQCGGLFSPRKFVTHAHDGAENKTCHWGFSSDNWRIYLRLSEAYSEVERERHLKVLDDFKLRFWQTTGSKRPQEIDHYEGSESVYVSQTKKSKLDDPKLEPYPHHHAHIAAYPSIAHRPWSPPIKGGGRYPGPPSAGGSAYSLEPHHGPHHNQAALKLEEDKFSNYSTSPVSSAGVAGNGSGGNTNSYHPRYKDSPYSVIPKKKYLEEHERFPTLADEISRIKTALDGAPVHAKEAVLKILERLTARVDRAEREKDDAINRFRELQLKYGQLEDEFAKKRGELRELLRQDLKRISALGVNVSGVTDITVSSADNPMPLRLVKESKLIGSDGGDNEKSSSADPSSSECTGTTVLPKITLKSPAKVMEELNVPSSTRSEAGSVDREEDQEAQPSVSSPVERESLKERMVKMEAELNKLREEVSSRTNGKADLTTAKSPLAAPPTSSSALLSSTTPSSYTSCSAKLGSNGANSSSPTPSPPSHPESSPTSNGGDE